MLVAFVVAETGLGAVKALVLGALLAETGLGALLAGALGTGVDEAVGAGAL